MLRLRPLLPALGCALCPAAPATAVTAAARATPSPARHTVDIRWPAGARVPHPSHNFTTPTVRTGCRNAFSRTCENDYVYYLDRARHRMGLKPYRLPADFTSLLPSRQLFILANLDRIAYRVPPIIGLVPALDRGAKRGMYAERDPAPPAGFHVLGYGADWAGNYPNAPAAYFTLMYDDGPGSPNLDCTKRSRGGCWGHRRNMFFRSGYPGAGISVGIDKRRLHSYAIDIAGLTRPARSYVYTWADARRDGAGTHVYKVKKP